MTTIRSESIDARVLKLLMERYPITVEELKKLLNIRMRTIEMVIKKLVRQGIIELEPLPDKTFIRLVNPPSFLGLKPTQRRPIKHAPPLKVDHKIRKEKKDDEFRFMYA